MWNRTWIKLRGSISHSFWKTWIILHFGLACCFLNCPGQKNITNLCKKKHKNKKNSCLNFGTWAWNAHAQCIKKKNVDLNGKLREKLIFFNVLSYFIYAYYIQSFPEKPTSWDQEKSEGECPWHPSKHINSVLKYNTRRSPFAHCSCFFEKIN